VRQDRRKLSEPVLGEVADVYEAGKATGAPTKAVREHFGIAPSTASLYVRKARDAGSIALPTTEKARRPTP